MTKTMLHEQRDQSSVSRLCLRCRYGSALTAMCPVSGFPFVLRLRDGTAAVVRECAYFEEIDDQ